MICTHSCRKEGEVSLKLIGYRFGDGGVISGASAGGAGGGGDTDEDGSDTDTGTDGQETDDEETDGTDGAETDGNEGAETEDGTGTQETGTTDGEGGSDNAGADGGNVVQSQIPPTLIPHIEVFEGNQEHVEEVVESMPDEFKKISLVEFAEQGPDGSEDPNQTSTQIINGTKDHLKIPMLRRLTVFRILSKVWPIPLKPERCTFEHIQTDTLVQNGIAPPPASVQRYQSMDLQIKVSTKVIFAYAGTSNESRNKNIVKRHQEQNVGLLNALEAHHHRCDFLSGWFGALMRQESGLSLVNSSKRLHTPISKSFITTLK